MRLVKKSVNQDDPGTYHLFYADAEGHPGTDLTFFPWARMAPPRIGYGLAVEVGLEVPVGSLEYWGKRLETYGAHVNAIETRFGERTLSLVDPHGLRLALVEPARSSGRSFSPWDHSTVKPEHQVRGLYSAQLWERGLAPTTAFLTSILGFKKIAEENGWTRFAFDNATGVLDIRDAPDAARGLGRRERAPPRLAGGRRVTSARRARQVETADASPRRSSIASGSSRSTSGARGRISSWHRRPGLRRGRRP